MNYYYPFHYYPFPQQHMMFAPYPESKGYTFPFVPMDEGFINVHQYMPQFKDYYYVSNYGRIYNTQTQMMMNTKIDPRTGYENTSLMSIEKNDKGQSYGKWTPVHRIVNTVFNGAPPEGYVTNHIDSIRANNYYKNLEWVTQQENVKYSFEHGFRQVGENNNGGSTFTDAQVTQICELMQAGIYDRREFSLRVFGCEPTKSIVKLLRRIRNKEAWTHISNNYNILENPKRFSFTDEQVRLMCQYMQDFPEETHAYYASHRLAALIGYNIYEMDNVQARRIKNAINDVRRRRSYTEISSQYNF